MAMARPVRGDLAANAGLALSSLSWATGFPVVLLAVAAGTYPTALHLAGGAAILAGVLYGQLRPLGAYGVYLNIAL